MAKAWQEQQERGSQLGLQITLWTLRILGSHLCKALAWPVLWYFYASDRVRRGYVREYRSRLNQHYGFQGGQEATWWDGFKIYKNFGFGLIDRFSFWQPRLRRAPRFDWQGKESLLEHLAQGQGAILLSAHVGNLDALRSEADFEKVPIHPLMYQAHAQRFNAMMRRINPALAESIIPLAELDPELVFRLQGILQKGGFLGLLGDRITPGAPEKKAPLDFLGKRAWFPLGPYWLALLLQAPLYSFFCAQVGNQHYRIQVHQLYDGRPVARKDREKAIQAMMGEYVADLEDFCHHWPEQWNNFLNFWENYDQE